MFDMNGAELRESLISTVRHLLDYKENIELQLAEAKKILIHSFEQSERESLKPISIESDALWFNYLLESLEKANSDIALALKALSQLGVSLPKSLVSSLQFNRHEKNQGDFALDFSVSREK